MGSGARQVMKTSLVRGERRERGGRLRHKEWSLHFTAYREPQGDIRGGTVFNIRHARLRMKEGVLPKKTRKSCIVKDITRLFKSDGLKTLGFI